MVDFKTGEVYSIEDRYAGYMIRDYYVIIDHEDDRDLSTIFCAGEERELLRIYGS